MKFVMALCVVTIHTCIVDIMEPSLLRDILHSLIRSAVPFFFITSAFFIMKRKDDSDIKRYWKRILKLYIYWSIINCISNNALTNNMSLNAFLVSIRQVIFNGYSVLWYLWGILVVLPLLYRIKKMWGQCPFVFSYCRVCFFV